MNMLEKPLPERVRPQSFDEFFGQKAIWSKNSATYQMVKNDNFYSLIFWGPPGSGKTTLARIIGNYTKRQLIELSCVNATVKDLRAVFEESQIHLKQSGKSYLLFLDEVHRLNKSQQDVLLPALEQGMVKFIGATTENPSFQVNPAVLSRSLVMVFTQLEPEELINILKQALHHQNSLLKRTDVSDDVLSRISHCANGDARQALNLLEAVITAAPEDLSPINQSALNQVSDTLRLHYDRARDFHYDTISAFIKSVRASHPDAALYYLARMLESGEDILFIARRLVIAASEDIGNANPTALLVATAGMQAVDMVGMPEARIILAQATTYLASSPKSNRSYVAIDQAINDVRKTANLEIPLHLRNAPTEFMKSLKYGKDYIYPHDNLDGAQKLNYLPKELKGKQYYQPSDQGVERQIKETLQKLRPKED